MRETEPELPNESSKGRDHFDTDHLKADLKGKSVRSGAITVFAQFVRFGISTGSTMILARILVPEDFGLLAMCSAVLIFVNLFGNLGLSWATIQRQEINHAQISTLFWLNVAFGFLVACFTVAIAPLVAKFYSEPRLTLLTMGFAIPTFISGLATQHAALLSRQMRFAREQTNTLIALGVGFVAAIIAAMNGMGYWSILIQQIVSAILTVILFCSSVKWIPGKPQRGVGAREMLTFGLNLVGSGFVNRLSRHADNIIIGNFAGATALGYYSKAYSILMLPLNQINGPLGRVALPSLSRLQNEPSKFKSFYIKGVELTAFCGMPIIAFCYLEAENIVLVMLGDQWMETVDLFRALAPAALIGTFNMACGWLYVPLGRPRKEFVVTIFSSLITVAAFGIGIQWGAIGVAYSYSIVTILKIVPELYIASIGSPVTLGSILAAISRPFLAVAISAPTAMYLQRYWEFIENPIIHPIVTFVVFSTIYSSSIFVLPGGKAFTNRTISTLQESFFKKRKK